MRRQLDFAAQRFAVFANQVLEPAVFTQAMPLQVAAWQAADPVPCAEALGAEYEPVEIGWRWGPAWSTAWLHITGRVPSEMRGRPVALRFSSGTEALLWQNGGPYHGFDPNHETAVLFDPSGGDEELDLFVEAACNHPFGTTGFAWQDTEFNRRWSEPKPGRLERCELAVFDRVVWRLWRAYEFARQLMVEFPDEAERGQRLCAALRSATAQIDDTNVAATAPRATEVLLTTLSGKTPAAATHCLAVGHAHIDTAWLWPLRETKRKCLRTFATALRLMDQYPDFRFLGSQAQQYAWLEETSRGLFERVAQRVREGRWEPGGAMWVEPDCNVPSGESLVRQILYGVRYWEARFGEQGQQRFLYLPDTFGYSAALPQIMALAGLDTFITNKLAWNDTTEFPHVNFRWRGLDGTEVLAHCTPGHDYNATLSPAELRRGEKNMARKDGARTGVWLQPYGFGDGGGGPTARMIQSAQLAERCDGLPSVSLARTDTFCDELHRRRSALQATGHDLPVWDGELYLEYHRGTYTTQAWLKRANRKAEQALRMAEWLACAGPVTPEPQQAARIQQQLDEVWKLVLLNQFHDILPGSSITPVYEEARQQHEHVREVAASLIDDGLRRWARQADTTGLREPMIVFNPASTPRTGVVECGGQVHYVEEVPALGVAICDRAAEPFVTPVSVQDRTLANGLVSAALDAAGRLVSLRHLPTDREACRTRPSGEPEPLNQLVLYEDRPRAWDAWDIDADYEEKAFPVDGPVQSWQVVEDGPLRAAIEVVRPLGHHSHITQRFVLEAGAPRLDVHTRVDWRESHRLLRALFPLAVRARRATYETQYGHIERPTHRNMPRDQARFEVCAHRWADLSEPGFGVALLNDCKYGHSCHDGVLGLSLLRSPEFPDPQADQGPHEFLYSVMPHDGDWRSAGVAEEAAALNAPLTALPLPPGQAGALRGAWSPFTVGVRGAAGVEVSAVKGGVDGDRLIVRLVETHGGRGEVTIRWSDPVRAVEVVDLLERPMTDKTWSHDTAAARTQGTLRPFQIITLATSRP